MIHLPMPLLSNFSIKPRVWSENKVIKMSQIDPLIYNQNSFSILSGSKWENETFFSYSISLTHYSNCIPDFPSWIAIFLRAYHLHSIASRIHHSNNFINPDSFFDSEYYVAPELTLELSQIGLLTNWLRQS